MDKHLLQAAGRGDAEAQFNLGIMYENGLGDSRYNAEGDRSEAVRWLLAAAEQGLPRAQIKLAAMYAGEPDTPENSVKACGWLLLAAKSLHGAQLQSAQSAYRRVSASLTPAEIERARNFAQGWTASRPAGPAELDRQESLGTMPAARRSPAERRSPGSGCLESSSGTSSASRLRPAARTIRPQQDRQKDNDNVHLPGKQPHARVQETVG